MDFKKYKQDFWSLVKKEDKGCWLWLGPRYTHGACWGRVFVDRSCTTAHRMAYLLTYGDIPRNIKITQSCRNSLCVRPEHLIFLDVPTRFWRMVNKSDVDGCWTWRGSPYMSFGYSRFKIEKKHFAAHRMAYILTFGDIPKDKCVCHKCDNPRCVRPDHLFLGSSKENVQDMTRKGRGAKGENNGRAKLNWARVREIRNSFKLGISSEQLSIDYNVARNTIYDVVRNRHWIEQREAFTRR